MRTRVGVLAVLVGATLVAGGCSRAERQAAPRSTSSTVIESTTTTVTPTTAAPKRKRPSGLHSLSAFAGCNALLRHVKDHALKVVTPYGLPFSGNGVGQRVAAGMVTADAAMAAPSASSESSSVGAGTSSASAQKSAGVDYSGTNIQEAGVDEPDLLKSDGNRLVTVAKGKLQIIDISKDTPRTLGSMELLLEDGMFQELLIDENRVVLFGNRHPAVNYRSAPGRMQTATSVVRVVDIADPATPKTVSTLNIDGQYVSARMVGGVVRMVVNTDPQGPPMPATNMDQNFDETRALAANKAAIARSTVDQWLPTYTLERPGQNPVTKPVAPCAAVLRPQEFAGLGTVSVMTIDPKDPQPANPACVLGGGSIVYASPENVYVATQRWEFQRMAVGDIGPGGAGSGMAPSRPVDPKASMADTELHQFAIPGGNPAEYVASGQIQGTILNQFSMSEHKGFLRLAATTRFGDGRTESTVHALQANDDAKLVSVGKLGGLGHEGETIHSVRFIGDRGYVVTFRQTDPLYVIDLADPRKPVARGELQVPGFSSYLHPLSDTVLIGVGQGSGEQGGRGLQLSLFDVADPARPVRTANVVLPNVGSEAQNDHHAFLWWAPTNQLVLPTVSYEQQTGKQATGASVFNVDPKGGFGPPRLVSHDEHFQGDELYTAAPVRRSMVVGSRLLTLSDGGLRTSDLASLREQGWLAW